MPSLGRSEDSDFDCWIAPRAYVTEEQVPPLGTSYEHYNPVGFPLDGHQNPPSVENASSDAFNWTGNQVMSIGSSPYTGYTPTMNAVDFSYPVNVPYDASGILGQANLALVEQNHFVPATAQSTLPQTGCHSPAGYQASSSTIPSRTAVQPTFGQLPRQMGVSPPILTLPSPYSTSSGSSLPPTPSPSLPYPTSTPSLVSGDYDQIYQSQAPMGYPPPGSQLVRRTPKAKPSKTAPSAQPYNAPTPRTPAVQITALRPRWDFKADLGDRYYDVEKRYNGHFEDTIYRCKWGGCGVEIRRSTFSDEYCPAAGTDFQDAVGDHIASHIEYEFKAQRDAKALKEGKVNNQKSRKKPKKKRGRKDTRAKGKEEKKEEEPLIAPDGTRYKFECLWQECSERYLRTDTPRDRHRHFKTHIEWQITCEHCDKVYSRVDQVRLHKRKECLNKEI